MAHLLIASATSAYPNLSTRDARPQLIAVLNDIVTLFTNTMGRYRRELPSIGENPPSEPYRKTLDAWFASADRQPEDWIVLYYTGHAQFVDDSLYLLPTDFVPTRFFSTAVNAEQLAHLVLSDRGQGRGRQVRNLLVILDTCFAGKGVKQLASRLSNVFRRTSGSSFYMLGASLPLVEAQAGALARALIDAIEELSARHVTQEFLFFEQIVPAINRRLKLHKAIWAAVDSADESPQFFPNRNFVDTGGWPVAASDAKHAIDDIEFRKHWSPRARGVGLDTQPGFYFTGRQVILDKLWAYLVSPHEHRTHVVTGEAGAGKSAILSEIVTRAPRHSVDDAPSIDLAVHLKGKTLQDVVERAARAIGSGPNVESVIETLRLRSTRFRIVVDALDEAAEPAAVAARLLAPLNTIPSVKLVIGTREDYVRMLSGVTVIDIDSPTYAAADEFDRFTDYVRNRLLRNAEPPAFTPYAGRPGTAKRVAEVVAKRAYPNFLVARLVAEDLLSRLRVVDADSVSEAEFPATVADAFDGYLASFGESEQRIRDLLLPLAYAEGHGLPWDNLWAPLASALARRKYGDDDVKWAIGRAGTFILETTDQGRAVYRLYHQALADTLRGGKRTKAIHKAFAKVLTSSCPPRANGNGRDWLLASRYARSHLSTHAGYAGALPDLLTDPQYLIAADPTRLLLAIAKYPDLPRDLVGVYKGIVHHVRGELPSTAASYVELAARQRGLPQMATEAAELPFTYLWHVRWANWTTRAASQLLARGSSEIISLSAVDIPDLGLLALVGRRDGTVEAWDVAEGKALVRWRPDDVYAVWQVGAVDTQGGPVLVAAWVGGEIGSFELRTGRCVLQRDRTGEQRAATAMCLAQRNGQVVCITAHQDRRVVMRAVPQLDIVLEMPAFTRAKIYGLATTPIANGSVLVTACDSLIPDKDAIDDSMLRLWSLDDLSLLWADGREERGALHDIEFVRLFGRDLVVISQHGLGPAQLWDLSSRVMVAESGSASQRAWAVEFGGQAYLLEERYRTLHISRIIHDEKRPGTVTLSLAAYVPSVSGERFSGIVPLHDRPSLLTAERDADHIRLWDVQDVLSEALAPPSASAEVLLSQRHIKASTVNAARRDVIYTGTLCGIVALDAVTGATLWQRQLTDFGDGMAVPALVAVPDANTLAVAGSDGRLYLLDLETRELSQSGKLGREIKALRVVRWRGRAIAFATVEREDDWTVRVWDLDSGEELETAHTYGLTMGEGDKEMPGLTVAVLGETVRFAFASAYAKVMVASFTDPLVPSDRFRGFDEWHIPNGRDAYVKALASAKVANELLLVATTSEGVLVLWNFATGELKGSVPDAHLGEADGLVFGYVAGRPVIMSGGDDGRFCLWSTDLERLATIDIGEAITTLACVDERVVVGSRRGALLVEWRALLSQIPA